MCPLHRADPGPDVRAAFSQYEVLVSEREDESPIRRRVRENLWREFFDRPRTWRRRRLRDFAIVEDELEAIRSRRRKWREAMTGGDDGGRR